MTHYTGGCLCGALRYVADAAPRSAGYCFCADCRRASGSGFIPFMNFDAGALRFTGMHASHASPALRGEAVRNFCPTCGSLVFGGPLGATDSHTIYAGSLDDPSLFRPTIAIFARERPEWMPMPPGLAIFDAMP